MFGSRLTVLLVVAVAWLATAGGAYAMTDLGQTLVGAGSGPGPTKAYFVQTTDNGTMPYAVPAGPGVLTRFSVGSGTTFGAVNTVNLLTWRKEGAMYRLTGVSASSNLTTTSSWLGNYPARIPVSGGERIGLLIDSTGNTARCYGTGGGENVARIDGVSAVGDAGISGTLCVNSRVNVSAVWEPDADGDGYGDESQDLCPGDAAHGDTACSGQLIGSSLQNVWTNGLGCLPAMSCNYLSSAVPAGNASLPANGVIVRWRVKGALATNSFALGRFQPAGGDNFTVSDAGATLAGHALDARMISHSGSVRIPYTAGSLLGISGTMPVNFPANLANGAGFGYRKAAPAGAEGATVSAPATANAELLFNADVEPDADGDGYGDVTQDACPSQQETTGACWPKVTKVVVTPKKFRVDRRGRAVSAAAVRRGAKLKFTLADQARVMITLYRTSKGRTVGKKCRRQTRANRGNKRCTIYRERHYFRRNLKAGRKTIRFAGLYRDLARGRRVRAAAPGAYVFRVKASNANGLYAAMSNQFRIVR